MDELLGRWVDRLDGVADADLRTDDHAATLSGPRYWWGGALDVEGLALASTRTAATALNRLTRRNFSTSSAAVAASFSSFEHLRIDGRSTRAFAPMSGFHRTADGWVRLHANYPHHRAVLERFLATQNHQLMEARLAALTNHEIEDGLAENGGVASGVRSPEDWSSSAMGRAVAHGPWIRFTQDASRDETRASSWTAPDDNSDAPLRGLRVLNLTRVIAGPSAARLLGALGADVIRVDPPQYPEDLDQHIDTGFSQRSVTLDLRESTDSHRLQELMRTGHVVLQGYRPDALGAHGWSSANMLDINPRLKVVSLSAWGRTGPWSERRGFDSIVQAATGIADLYRDDTGVPGRLPLQALDHATGMGMVAAVALMLDSTSLSSAELSLARTAHELLTMPTPQIRQPGLPLEVSFRTMASTPYGELRYVPPPFWCDGRSVEFRHPPVRYGSSEARWR